MKFSTLQLLLVFVPQDSTELMEYAVNVVLELFTTAPLLFAIAFARPTKSLMVHLVSVQAISRELMEYVVNVPLEQLITKIPNFVSQFVKLMKFSMELHVFVQLDSLS